MKADELLYDRALQVTQENASLYDQWESYIAFHMEKKWSAAFLMAEQVSGSEEPTVMEVADMGATAIDDHNKFINDLSEVFRILAKGCALNSEGDWS
jgi:hypothetical protein